MSKLKLFVSKWEFPIPEGCERVPYTNPLAHIYLMAYHNTREYPPDEYIIQYSPQEGVTQRHYYMEMIECPNCGRTLISYFSKGRERWCRCERCFYEWRENNEQRR